MLEPLSPPWTYRLAESMLAWAQHIGLTPNQLDPATLIAKACKRTGLVKLNPTPQFSAGLQRLSSSVQKDANLRPLGFLAMQDLVLTALETRLLAVNLQKSHAQAFRTPLEKPCLVLGFPRSGTTLLHRLLALAHDARSLATWEVQRPFAPFKGRDTRRRSVQRQLKHINAMSPMYQVKHPTSIEDPEEDWLLLNPTMLSATFCVFAPLTSYADWFFSEDHDEAYQSWAATLAWFQHQSPNHRLTLKAPIHTAFVDSVLASIPNMTIVHMHRDPIEVMGSFNSLLHTFQILMSYPQDPVIFGHRNLRLLEQIYQRYTVARSTCNEHILDLSYTELVSNPIQSVSRVHDHIGIPFTDRHRQSIQRHLNTRPKNALGKHQYSLEECGLTPDLVRTQLADYLNSFEALCSPRP